MKIKQKTEMKTKMENEEKIYSFDWAEKFSLCKNALCGISHI